MSTPREPFRQLRRTYRNAATPFRHGLHAKRGELPADCDIAAAARRLLNEHGAVLCRDESRLTGWQRGVKMALTALLTPASHA